MAKKINISIKLLKETTEIAEAEEFDFDDFYLDSCRLPGSWVERWQARHDYVKPGISQDQILAIAGTASADASLDFSPLQFAATTKNFFLEYFSIDDILACGCGIKNENAVCHFLIYPLHGRQLDPFPWIDGHTRQFKQSIVNVYISRLAQFFRTDLSADLEVENNGHTEYLDNFPTVTTSPEEETPVVYETLTEEDSMQTDFPKDKVKSIINDTVKAFTTGTSKGDYIKLMQDDITLGAYLEHARVYVLRNYPDISDKDLRFVMKRVKSSAAGYYVLDDLLNDVNISDVKVMNWNLIRVKVRGSRRTSNLKFIDDADYRNFIENIITRFNLSRKDAINVRTDLFSNEYNRLRLNLTLPQINTGGVPILHIRKVPKKKQTLQDLVRAQMMDPVTANYLIWAARNAKGIVFTGKGSSGKTTLMNALLEYTPANASGVVIQESEELFTETRPELMFQHITPDYDLKALAKNGLLTDVDYFIIGEVKGGEAMYFINACDTGNKGWCSVHSPSSREAINKLADYVMYDSKYDREEALYMLKELQVVVFLRDFKVVEISEVVGWDPILKDLKYKPVLIDTAQNSINTEETEEEEAE